MNVLEIIILVLTAAFAIAGFQKGFVRKLASMLSLVLSVALVSFALPYVTQFLKDSTPVYDYIADKSEKIVSEQIAEMIAAEGADQAQTNQYLTGNASLDRSDQVMVIDGLPIPETLKDMLLDYNNAEGYANFQVSTFQDYVTQFLATMIMNVVSFLAAVILVQLILWAVIGALDILAHIPVVNTVNRLAGLLLGLLQALVCIWIFFLVLSMLSGTEAGYYLLSMVQESEILCRLYDSNLFLRIVLQTSTFFAV